jgi:MATE family multidrug resistance protein
MIRRKDIGEEIRHVVELAGPLVAAEIGWMLMSIVDVVMVGRMPDSAAAIGAVSIGGVAFYTVGIFAAGILLGMDPLIARSFGAGDLSDCNHTLLNSLYLILPMTPALLLLSGAAVPALAWGGVHPAVMEQIRGYLPVLLWSAPALLLFMVVRHYLQCLNHVRIIMFALVSANLVNLLFNWVLIFGHWGAPAMGVQGAAWATVMSRIYMAAVVVAFLVRVDRRERLRILATDRSVDLARIRQVVRLGLPAATQIILEMSVFGIAAALIGRLGPVPIASHQVALSVVAFTYMVPLGVGAAAAVRVGQALGAGDPVGARRSGWTAMALGAGFMACAGVVILLAPQTIVRIFTSDPLVVAAAVPLLLIGAVFQLFDGFQAVATGALRGAGETRIPMLSFLFAYWSFGVPLGYYLGLVRGWGPRGFWVGFCAALVSVGIVLFTVWHRKSQAFGALPREGVPAPVLQAPL